MLCVCMCVRACVRACACVCVCVQDRAPHHMCMCVCAARPQVVWLCMSLLCGLGLGKRLGGGSRNDMIPREHASGLFGRNAHPPPILKLVDNLHDVPSVHPKLRGGF